MTTAPAPNAPVQLVVFDLMGTLISDDEVVASAYDAALVQAGMAHGSPEFEGAQQRVTELRGRPTLLVLTEVLGDPILAEEATWAFDDTILDSVGSMVEVPGAGTTLAALREQSILTAVTTSFTPEVRRAVLRHMGWTETFAARLSAHGHRRGHPAPDLLLHAILELRIDSVGQVAIVGDSPSDLVAGNRAGAGMVIGVRSGGTPEDLLVQAPHTHLLDSIADLMPVLNAPHLDGQRRASDR